MANERAERARNWSLHHECSSISHVGM
jgi:hypothetical protein